MDFETARKSLIEAYSSYGLTLISEEAEEIILANEPFKFVINKDDIQDYAIFMEKGKNSEFKIIDCGICSKSYREQIVIPTDPYPFLSFPMKEQNILFGEQSTSSVYVEMGIMSKDFFNSLRFNKDFYRSYCKFKFDEPRSISRMTALRNACGFIAARNMYPDLRTIKVFNLASSNVEQALGKSSKIIEDCLFELAYLKNAKFWIVEEWPYKRLAPNLRFRFGERFAGWHLPMKATFNSEIIRFYQLGMTSTLPELKFLAYYQVLEYFYASVTMLKLIETIAGQIKDPKFKVSNDQLIHVVQTVNNFNNENDETKMLKNVLSKFIDESELISFIQSYEQHLNDHPYTKKHEVFGTSLEIKLEIGHCISNVATQIKETRNALVHSTDRREGSARHVPFTATTKQIERDIPLIKFLAEKVIVASSTPI